MRLPSRLALLLLTTVLTLGATAPPAAKPAARAAARPAARPVTARAASDPAARKAVEAVVARYRSLRSYRIVGQATSEAGNGEANNITSTVLQFTVRRPDRFTSHIQNTEMDTYMVSDGDSLWTAVPALGQYLVQSMVSVRAGADSVALSRQFDPGGEYARLLDGVTVVRALGRDTVHTVRGIVTCRRYVLTTPNAEAAAQGVTLHPRVIWVDPVTRMVLMDSVRIEQKHPQLGAVHSVNVTRMVVAEADPELPADAFRFSADAGLRRVRRFMRSSPEHSALEGQPAHDFTLETLADAKAVKLSDLKGKVVVLDFWATWCGPCRKWLPIVAKARHEFESKGLVVYAVNEREPEGKVREYLKQQKLDVPVLMDVSGSVGQQYRANSIPLTVVVGRDGNVLRVMLGLHQEDDLREVLKEAGIE